MLSPDRKPMNKTSEFDEHCFVYLFWIKQRVCEAVVTHDQKFINSFIRSFTSCGSSRFESEANSEVRKSAATATRTDDQYVLVTRKLKRALSS